MIAWLLQVRGDQQADARHHCNEFGRRWISRVRTVMKFGGSSLESAGAIQQAVSIVERHLNQNPVVVVSAMGKTTG